MMNHSLKKPFSFPSGTNLQGKWHKQNYTIVKELGYGANGIVYLAQSKSGYVALKMSDNSYSVTSEVNVLKAFSKASGTNLGPTLIDVDDWDIRGKVISFYIMEYVEGPDLLSFVKEKGYSWVPVLMLQLLNNLEQMHQAGWVFGDLKPDNLIITGSPYRIRCIDVGGTTIRGRAIKEFTEFFDRGYWGVGSRKAEPSYDLFAVGMIMINLAYKKRVEKQGGGVKQLQQLVNQKQELIPYKQVIMFALKGQYQTAEKMRTNLLQIMSVDTSPKSINPRKGVPPQKKAHTTRQKRRKQSKVSSRLETLLVVIILSVLYVLYIYGELL
ncbi:protein kinase domain-containing protein [Bacillus sp. 2205SS5-2]|uniref:protein kinase domain-containing protein n=1 Tax=Bacillus sp. 2205SS5-2 TaxID=3109031 RepID=UPI003006AB42